MGESVLVAPSLDRKFCWAGMCLTAMILKTAMGKTEDRLIVKKNFVIIPDILTCVDGVITVVVSWR